MQIMVKEKRSLAICGHLDVVPPVNLELYGKAIHSKLLKGMTLSTEEVSQDDKGPAMAALYAF